MRLIDADALLELYSSGIPEFDAMAVPIPVIRQNIAAMPTVDASPVVHGRWITTVYTTTSKRGRIISSKEFECSKCGYSNGRKQSNYCPNCGAKMDGG